jgi:metallophosphoesterase superfamily enzyme
MPDVLDRLARWCASSPAKLILVIGNHDRRALARTDPPFETTRRLQLGGIEIVHDPADVSPESQLTIGGHLHPVIRIRDGRRTSIRSACFWLRGNTLTLPSFGSFTGGQIIHPAAEDRIFIPIRDKVAEVPSQCWK